MNSLITKYTHPNLTEKAYQVPRIHLDRDGETYRLQVELPGVRKDQVEVTVEDRLLTVTGRRDRSNARSLYSERTEGDFRRTFSVDPSIDLSTLNAELDQGLLTLTFQKVAALKPRKVEIK